MSVAGVFQYRITSLATAHQTHTSGIPYSEKSVTFKDGSTRPTYDLILRLK